MRQLDPNLPLPDDATLEEFEAWEWASSHEALRYRIETWHSDGYVTYPTRSGSTEARRGRL